MLKHSWTKPCFYWSLHSYRLSSHSILERGNIYNSLEFREHIYHRCMMLYIVNVKLQVWLVEHRHPTGCTNPEKALQVPGNT